MTVGFLARMPAGRHLARFTGSSRILSRSRASLIGASSHRERSTPWLRFASQVERVDRLGVSLFDKAGQLRR
jgi:hypothetical protein